MGDRGSLRGDLSLAPSGSPCDRMILFPPFPPPGTAETAGSAKKREKLYDKYPLGVLKCDTGDFFVYCTERGFPVYCPPDKR